MDHVKALSIVVFSGFIVAVKVIIFPARNTALSVFKATLSIGTSCFLTVTVHVAVLLLTVVTVIVAFPAESAVTFPC